MEREREERGNCREKTDGWGQRRYQRPMTQQWIKQLAGDANSAL